MRRKPVLFLGPVVLVGVVVAGVAVSQSGGDDGYSVDVVMPTAANIVDGGRVTVDGFDAGKVEGIRVQDDKAIVTVSVSADRAPLPAGTTARIEYRALLGERVVVLDAPEAPSTATIPDGGMVIGAARTDLDQVLAALDDETLEDMRVLLPQVDALLTGRETDINESIQAAGPVADALGEVLAAIGHDGPQLRQLLEDTRTISATVAERRAEVAASVDGLTAALRAAADERAALSAGLEDLPEALGEATGVLNDLPATVNNVDPLLSALQPAIDRLPAVSEDLRPLLADLRPAVTDLEASLANLGIVLTEAPAVLDLGTAVIPTLDSGLTEALPILDFLRPYTPELTGWLVNWGGAAAGYDANGHYIRLAAKVGAGNNVGFPTGLSGLLNTLPGLGQDTTRDPGQVGGQAWTDANGDPIR